MTTRPMTTTQAPDRQFLLGQITRLYQTGTQVEIEAFLHDLGREAFRDLHDGAWGRHGLKKDFVRPDRPARVLDLDILRLVHGAGVDLGPVIPTMMEQIIEQDAIAGHEFLTHDLEEQIRYSDYSGLRWLVMHCRPAMASVLAQEIGPLVRVLLESRVDTDIGPQDCPAAYPLKCFAVLALCGGDARRAFHTRRHPEFGWHLSPRIKRLLEATASAHGRLWLHGLEPSPAAVLARPHTEPFLGLTQDSFRAGFTPTAKRKTDRIDT